MIWKKVTSTNPSEALVLWETNETTIEVPWDQNLIMSSHLIHSGIEKLSHQVDDVTCVGFAYINWPSFIPIDPGLAIKDYVLQKALFHNVDKKRREI